MTDLGLMNKVKGIFMSYEKRNAKEKRRLRFSFAFLSLC